MSERDETRDQTEQQQRLKDADRQIDPQTRQTLEQNIRADQDLERKPLRDQLDKPEDESKYRGRELATEEQQKKQLAKDDARMKVNDMERAGAFEKPQGRSGLEKSQEPQHQGKAQDSPGIGRNDPAQDKLRQEAARIGEDLHRAGVTGGQDVKEPPTRPSLAQQYGARPRPKTPEPNKGMDRDR